MTGSVIGDVLFTRADTYQLQKDFNVVPSVTLDEGLRQFVDWYIDYQGVNLGK
jgi:UDP-glucuronate 4-epimerase